MKNGILHRGLKADNIFVLLTPDGSPFASRIGDFDVASNELRFDEHRKCFEH